MNDLKTWFYICITHKDFKHIKFKNYKLNYINNQSNKQYLSITNLIINLTCMRAYFQGNKIKQ